VTGNNNNDIDPIQMIPHSIGDENGDKVDDDENGVFNPSSFIQPPILSCSFEPYNLLMTRSWVHLIWWKTPKREITVRLYNGEIQIRSNNTS